MRSEYNRPVIKLIHHQVGEADRTPDAADTLPGSPYGHVRSDDRPGRTPTNYARARLVSLAVIPDGGCQLSLVTGPIALRASTVEKVPSLVRYLPIALVPADPPQTRTVTAHVQAVRSFLTRIKAACGGHGLADFADRLACPSAGSACCARPPAVLARAGPAGVQVANRRQLCLWRLNPPSQRWADAGVWTSYAQTQCCCSN
jgi:hypothetical protein